MKSLSKGRAICRYAPNWYPTDNQSYQTQRKGTITVHREGIIWQPDSPLAPEQRIPIGRVVTVESIPSTRQSSQDDSDSLAIHTPEHMYIFTNVEDSDFPCSSLANVIRESMSLQFASTDEVVVGRRPRRLRGVAGPHVVMAISDLSWGESASFHPLKVEISTVHKPYSWKRKIVLAEDVYRHLQAMMGTLVVQANQSFGIAEVCRDFGALLLHNTLSARALNELELLMPSLVTLRVDELLVHFPWGIIHDGNRYPMLDYAVAQQISTVHSTEMYGKLATNRPCILILSNPTLDLPGTVKEAKAITSHFEQADSAWQVTHRTGSEVSRIDVLTAFASGRYHVIHYAGHGKFQENSPENSCWLLNDGPLTGAEISQNVEGNPPYLVYASSCEAGREESWGRLDYQRQLFGLASAFLNGGVHNYIGGYWPILDEEAARLAVDFYGHLLQGLPIAEAMRRAKHRLANDGGDPLLWGGVTLFGDPGVKLQPPT